MRSRRRTPPAGAAARGTARRGPIRPQLLVVNLGNSRTTLARFSGDALESRVTLTTRRRTTDECAFALSQAMAAELGQQPRAAVLCSVVPRLTGAWRRALERFTGVAPVEAGPATAPLRIRYADPATLGPDRIANAIAARERHGAPAIVVDLGTATNFDCVSAEGEFVGGAIAPGIGLSAEALAARAARLPRVTLEAPERALATDTTSALRVGLVWGAAALVDGLVRRLAHEMGGRPRVIGTGGFARWLAPECETMDVVDEDLTLHGLRILWEAKK